MGYCELPPSVQKCLYLLSEAGFSAYVVGGAVRDLLLGRKIHDFDCTTNARPEQMLAVFAGEKVIPTGIRHGTLTVLIDDQPIEVTTYRQDATYEDHRHPDQVFFTDDLENDCRRRDFTINAMCYHPYEGIIDFFHGQDDLKAGIIRTVGDPDQRFTEDALRILRAIRFAAQLGFTIEPATDRSLRAHAHDLTYISIERITDEWRRILESPRPGALLHHYQDVIAVFLPEADLTEDLARQIDRSAADADIRMALVLQARPDADTILKRLRYRNSSRHLIGQLLALQDAPLSSRLEQRRLLSRLGIPRESYLCFRQAQDPSSVPDGLAAALTDVAGHDCIHIRQLAVSGGDLDGWPPVKRSVILQILLQAVMEEKVPNEKEALLDFLKHSCI